MSLMTRSLARLLAITGILIFATGCPGTDPPQQPVNLDMDAPDLGKTFDMPTGDMSQGTPLSIAAISAEPTSGKAPLAVNLSVTGQGGQEPYRVTWTFGDNTMGAEGAEVSHTYTTGGEFIARATVTDAAGASASASQQISVDPPDVPVINEIKATPTQGVAPLTTSFQATVSGTSNPLLFQWDFRDGEGSDRPSPTHVFSQGGTYAVSLTVTDEVTGAASAPATIEVKVASDDAPVAAASATPQQGIAPLNVSLRGTVVGGNEPYTFSWNFGDGSDPATSQNPSHEYTSPGTYTALFTVTDADGDSDTAMVVINAQSNAVPQIDIGASPSTGLAPLSVQFDPRAMGGDLPLSYEWDFGDGDTSTQSGPSHVFQMPGTYTVSLRVTDGNGDQATDSTQIVVNGDDVPAVMASATPTQGLAPLQVQFTSNAMGGNGALTYAWSFGDGSSDTGRNVQYTYPTAGQFTATVTVTDADGDVATDTVTIDVGSNLAPSANASATPTSGFAPLAVDFFGNASGGNGNLTYNWTFGDGSPSSSSQNPTHSYTSSGTYTATLIVTDEDGDSSTDTVIISVLDNAVPVVDASASPAQGIVPFNVNFQATVSQGDAPFTFQWDFGDGSQPSTQQDPSHSYTMGGTFTATVTVTDANGDTDSDTVQITAADNTQPVVTASADTDTGPRPLTVNFSAAGQGGNGTLSYQWFFGDGSAPATGATTSHTYQNQGIYTATVIVTDDDGDTSQDDVTINVLDQAPDLTVDSFTVTPVGRDLEFEVVIRNAGVVDATSSFSVRFYQDLAAAPDATTTSSTSRSVFSSIAPGGTTTVTATLFDRPIGDYNAWVYIDPLRDNPDLDRSNNIGGPVNAQVAGLVINEVYYDSPSTDTATFVEIYGLPGLDLSGYVLEEIDGNAAVGDPFTLPQGTVIPADGYLVVGDGTVANEDVNAGAWADLQNGPDNLVLKDNNGVVIDSVGWGDFAAASFFGEGSSTTDASAGYSIGRDVESIDTDDNADDFYVWRVPTPGAVNAVSFVNDADTCADAYLISDGVNGRFVIEGNLGGTTNNYTALDNTASGCAAANATLGGADQVLSFTVPAGQTGEVFLDLDDNASVDIDVALTGDPCSSLNMGLVGCNVVLSDTYSNLAPGTYYLVVFEDSTTFQSSQDEPYRYEIELTFQ